jgi:cytochrome c556
LAIGTMLLAPVAVRADDDDDHHDKLPAGPIRERHELMESIGDSAEDINEAFAGYGGEGMNLSVMQREAQLISANAERIPSLFPKGSTDPNSRALPAIWENWDKFQALAKELQTQAFSLSQAAGAQDDENLKEKSQKMFATCKSCHDQFRKPEEKKK